MKIFKKLENEVIKRVDIAVHELVKLINNRIEIDKWKGEITSLRTANASFQKTALVRSEKINSLFDAIKHGDDDHQSWLDDAIFCHFHNDPIPKKKGKEE